jgi:quercetin 2,3-dioxygenase
MTLAAAVLKAGEKVEHVVTNGRYAWVQVAKGKVTIDDKELVAGDGAAITGGGTIGIRADGDAEVLVFDLA